MTTVLTSAHMREVESLAIGSGRVTDLELMERAARAVSEEIAEFHGKLSATPRRLAVLCGPGNNGGDGYAIARMLARRGWQVSLWAMGRPSALSAAAASSRSRWLELGQAGELAEFSAACCAPGTVIVDALFGIGLRRPLRGAAARAMQAATGIGPMVAVDILSGVNSDTGAFMSVPGIDPAPAALTVTFHCAKPGHYLREGGQLAGKLVIRSIGIEDELEPLCSRQQVCRLVERRNIPAASLLKTGVTGNKFDCGHVLVLAGGRGRGGAARLAARAALRIGAGLVTVGVEERAIDEHAAQLNAIMLQAVDDSTSLQALLDDPRINAVCAGPGLGTGPASRQLVEQLLRSGRKLVLDADALSMFQDDPAALFDAIDGDVVLTPHAGEFRRLFADLDQRLSSEPDFSKLDAAASAARRSNATVLFKGSDTVIADPDGQLHINPATGEMAAPWLATAGSGDVLAGMIAGLMARGEPGATAARLSAWLHVQAALKFGPGLIAEDLPEMLPAVLADLGNEHHP